MRLIDADDLGIGKANPEVFIKPEYAYGWNAAIDAIEAAPTIDAVPVVHCKDCKSVYDGADDFCCTRHVGLVKITPNSFCSYGERRDDDTMDGEADG